MIPLSRAYVVKFRHRWDYISSPVLLFLFFFFFSFSFFFYYEITCDKLSRRILEICTCWFRVDRVTLIKIAIRDFLPAAPWSAIFKVDIVQRRMQDAERLRNSVAQCMFCYPALISATCDNIIIYRIITLICFCHKR